MPGHAGGLEQLFHLQVYSLNPNKLLKNLSNHEAPYFAIKDLPAGYIFKLVIYSSNRRGKSKTIEITGSTTEASPWKSGNVAKLNQQIGAYCLLISLQFPAEFESGDIYFELWPLAIVCGLIIMSFLLATAIFVKLRNRLKGKSLVHLNLPIRLNDKLDSLKVVF